MIDPRLNDPDLVAREYADERRLLARSSLYAGAAEDVTDRLIEAVAAEGAETVLEVGCGPGRLARRLREERSINVVALDLSPRMVRLAGAQGVDARVGDVQSLPFPDRSFRCVIAAWMLYHVPDLDRALAEIARVLVPGGALLAVTNSERHLSELWELVGLGRYPLPFSAENAEEILGRHFRAVSRSDAEAPITFPDRDAIVRYVASSIRAGHLADRVPAELTQLAATRRCAILRAGA